uniref:Uncharacterized protein n=1 Tax=Anopheles merus TaxID=30066 RepID=A0A182VG03_ANOME
MFVTKNFLTKFFVTNDFATKDFATKDFASKNFAPQMFATKMFATKDFTTKMFAIKILDVAVPMQYPVLAVTDQMAAAPQRPSAHLEQLGRRIVREDEVLVRPHEDVDHGERTGQDHAVRQDGQCGRRKHRRQIDPPADRLKNK